MVGAEHRLSSVLRERNTDRTLVKEAKEMPGGSIVSGSNVNTSAFSTFHAKTKRNWTVLREESAALDEIRRLFAGEKDVWPDQCRRAIDLLCRIQSPLQELSTLFNEQRYLPQFMLENSYIPILHLQFASEQVATLLTLISDFRSLCYKGSQRLKSRQHEIERRLDSLLNVYDEAIQQARMLSDRTRFPGKKNDKQTNSSKDLQKIHPQEKAIQTSKDFEERHEAYKHLQEALKHIQRAGDQHLEAAVLDELGCLCDAMGEKTRAATYHEELDDQKQFKNTSKILPI